jgi:hypothetical protein
MDSIMIKPSKKKVLFTLICFILFFIISCSEDKESMEQISVRFTDSSLSSAPKSMLVADTDFSSVMISVVRIEIVSETDSVVLEDFGITPLQIDLLDLGIDGVIVISEAEIGEGSFSQIRVIVEAPEENQGAPTNPDTYVTIGEDPTELPLYVPSGAETGLKVHLTPEIEVGPGQSFEITLDFNSMQSIHKTGANDRYIIRPTSMTATVVEVI